MTFEEKGKGEATAGDGGRMEGVKAGIFVFCTEIQVQHLLGWECQVLTLVANFSLTFRALWLTSYPGYGGRLVVK